MRGASPAWAPRRGWHECRLWLGPASHVAAVSMRSLHSLLPGIACCFSVHG